MKKLGIILGAVFVIVVSPFVVQYGWMHYYLSSGLCYPAKKNLMKIIHTL